MRREMWADLKQGDGFAWVTIALLMLVVVVLYQVWVLFMLGGV